MMDGSGLPAVRTCVAEDIIMPLAASGMEVVGVYFRAASGLFIRGVGSRIFGQSFITFRLLTAVVSRAISTVASPSARVGKGA